MASELTIERVLTAVEQVPAGRVVAYSDIAAIVGTSARRVGAIMRDHGATVSWWRVVNASGELPGELLVRAREHWLAEGILPSRTGRGCRIEAYRADLRTLAAAYAARMDETLHQAGLALPKVAAPARRALESISVASLEELAEHTRAEIAGLHGMGPKALGELDAALAGAGLAYRAGS